MVVEALSREFFCDIAVLNAAGHFVQFWDGRATTVEEQAKGPITNPVEMAMPSNAAAAQVIKSMPDYVALFQTAFPKDKDDPITYNNMALAIGAFERELVTPSRWDAFLNGDQSALTDAEKSGFNTFAATGCQWGGASYQRLGVVKPWPDQTDQGLYQRTKDANDNFQQLRCTGYLRINDWPRVRIRSPS